MVEHVFSQRLLLLTVVVCYATCKFIEETLVSSVNFCQILWMKKCNLHRKYLLSREVINNGEVQERGIQEVVPKGQIHWVGKLPVTPSLRRSPTVVSCNSDQYLF